MKKTLTLTGSLLALVLAACGGTSESSQAAALATGTNQVQGHGHDPAQFIQHFDKNGDGKLQVAELPQKMQDHLGKADANGDGVLGADELQKAFDERKQQMFAHSDKNSDGSLDATEVGADRWAHIAPADANKDGKITQAELDQAAASGTLPARTARHHHHGKKDHSPEAMIKRMDTNNDGKIEKSEVPANKVSWFDRVDANKDGVVTKDELVAFHAQHQHGGKDAGKK